MYALLLFLVIAIILVATVKSTNKTVKTQPLPIKKSNDPSTNHVIETQQDKKKTTSSKSSIEKPTKFHDLMTYNFNDDELSLWHECFAAIDFETAMPSRNSACSVGIVIFNSEDILARFYTLIQPPNNEYFIHNTRVHGITSNDTKNSPTFEVVYTILERLLPDKKIVAHNVSFDTDVFIKSALYYGINPFELIVALDTYRYYNAKLYDLCVLNDIKLDHHHAGSDAEACALLAIKALNAIKVETQNINLRAQELQVSKDKRVREVRSRPKAEQVFDPSNPFNNKKVVITGVFTNFPDRDKLRDLLSRIGSDVISDVTPKTNILVTGDKPGPSKITKANDLINTGKDLMIINEFDLLKMLAGIVIDEYDDGDFIKYEFIQIHHNQFSIARGSKLKPNN